MNRIRLHLHLRQTSHLIVLNLNLNCPYFRLLLPLIPSRIPNQIHLMSPSLNRIYTLYHSRHRLVEGRERAKEFYWVKKFNKFDKYEPALIENLLSLYEQLKDGKIKHACELIDYVIEVSNAYSKTLIVRFKLYSQAQIGFIEDKRPLIDALINVKLIYITFFSLF